MILHLDSLRSISRETLPGRLLSGMCLGKWRDIGDGFVPVVLPSTADLRAVLSRRMTHEEYKRRLIRTYVKHGPEEMIRPVVLSKDWAMLGMVQDGDTIVCACPRPGPKRKHPFCHLEVVTPFLVSAAYGVDVTLYGRLFRRGQ